MAAAFFPAKRPKLNVHTKQELIELVRDFGE
jgi:hypothetical protein